jgi:hypothetical protein
MHAHSLQRPGPRYVVVVVFVAVAAWLETSADPHGQESAATPVHAAAGDVTRRAAPAPAATYPAPQVDDTALPDATPPSF